jgi:hypothetical protein
VAATNFDTSRLRFGDLIAAGGGLLLIISLFLEWYSASAPENSLIDISFGVSGWQVLGFIDILLFLIGVAAIALAVLRAMGMIDRVPVPAGLLLLGLGALATLLVLFRILDIPGPTTDGVGRSFGVFVALIAALATLVGGWLSWNEEGRPSPGSVGGGSPGGAVGSGQPGGYGAPPSGAPVSSSAAPPATTPPAAAAPPAGAGAGAEAPPPGGKADWYPDPRGQKRLRYYDGTSWTDHVAD